MAAATSPATARCSSSRQPTATRYRPGVARLSTGRPSTATELDGVVVLNFWYAGCPPCRVEAPDLQAVYEEYGDDVTFVGVNIRDSAATAASFEKEFGVEYDSILDVSTRDVLSAFAGQVPPSAVPTTLVLDADGRVAARISGLLPSQTTLADILDDVLAEGLLMGEIVVDGALWLAVPIALAAGLLSFLSPCVLPLVPGYLGYVSGVAGGRREASQRRWCSGRCCSSPGFSARLRLGQLPRRHRRALLPRIRQTCCSGSAGRRHPARPRVHRAGHVPAAHDQAVVAAAHGTRRRAAARHRLRARLDAVHRPDDGDGVRRSRASTPCARSLLALVYCLGLGIPFVLVALGFGWVSTVDRLGEAPHPGRSTSSAACC